MTEVNLLPPELRRRQRTRNLTRQIVLGVAGVVLLLVVAWGFLGTQLSSVQSDLEAANAQNAALETQISSLQRFADLDTELSQKKTLVTDLEQAEVLWSGVLHDLSSVTPSDAYLSNFVGQVSIQANGWETQVGPTGLVGSMQFQGAALDYQNIALWLDRMVEVNGWQNAWVTSTDNGSAQGGTDTAAEVKFNGSVDLTPEATQNGTAP